MIGIKEINKNVNTKYMSIYVNTKSIMYTVSDLVF